MPEFCHFPAVSTERSKKFFQTFFFLSVVIYLTGMYSKPRLYVEIVKNISVEITHYLMIFS